MNDIVQLGKSEVETKIKEAERKNDQELLSRLLAEKQQWAQQHIETPS